MNTNSYTANGFSVVRKVLANLDKCSANGESNVVRSPWGVFKMYHKSERTGCRYYSVSGSSVLHNGGSYKMSTFRKMFSLLGF